MTKRKEHPLPKAGRDKLTAANVKWIKAVIVGLKPYGTRPHERRDSNIQRLINHYVKDLNVPEPLYSDLRVWRERGILMLPVPNKEVTSKVRRLAVYNPKIIFLLFGRAKCYQPFLEECGCDVRTNSPFFRKDDSVDWRIR